MAQPKPVTAITVPGLEWKSVPKPENRLMAAAALAGARNRANPTRQGRRFEACQMLRMASEKTWLRAKEDFFAAGKAKSGAAPASTANARPRPIHCGANVGRGPT